MRVYIAADSHLQAEVKELRDQLEALGIVVTSSWIDAKLEAFHPATEEELRHAAEKNFSDINRAVFLIAYNPLSRQKAGTGGRHVEMGYALARFKTVLYVGEKLENVFHRAIGVHHVHDLGPNTAPLAQVLAASIQILWNKHTAKVSER